MQILVIDFATPLVITDVHLTGGSRIMEFHLVQMSSTAMDMTACQIVDAIGTGTDINSFPGNGILKIASIEQVKSAECVDV
jgi:hypothetical protein